MSSPGNGWTRRIDPHGVGSRRISRPGPAGLDGVAAVPRQGGDDVQLVAAGGQLGDDAGEHATGRRRVGLEVRAEHDEAQADGQPSARLRRERPAPVAAVRR